MPSEVVKEAEEWAQTAKDAIGRKLRIDGMCMDAGVVSFPADRIDEWPAYRDEAIEWLKKVWRQPEKHRGAHGRALSAHPFLRCT